MKPLKLQSKTELKKLKISTEKDIIKLRRELNAKRTRLQWIKAYINIDKDIKKLIGE